MQELEDVSSESRSAIGELDRRLGELDRRLNEGIDQLNATADELADKVTRAEPSGGNIDDALAPLTESLKELENLVDTLLAIGGVALVAISAGFAVLYSRVSTLAKSTLDSSRHKRETPEPSTQQSAPNEENDDEEDKEEQERETGDRRVVTHTKKERTARRRSLVITELHNPEESWSPRTTEDVIQDIRTRNIPYFSRGRSGPEAEIQARRRLGKWYLKTKSDKYPDNNLENLPDPP